ncbi:MAG: DNA-3-methyladenine glycosylase [Anaerolineaceae bacterium]|nr:DNA-3-methyladenine glycosylase [Anaerolineaceae bacterium]
MKPSNPILPLSFYAEPSQKIARNVLGKRLVRTINGKRVGGYIIEAEAYHGESDLACHAKAGRTKRTAAMYGPPGHAFIYFTYGNHWMLNFVTDVIDFPSAVLIRAILPTEGLDEIALRRAGRKQKIWTDGPGKLTKALAIDKSFYGSPLNEPQNGLWVEEGIEIPNEFIQIGPRVGLGKTPEPWLSMPWRFLAVNPPEWLPE